MGNRPSIGRSDAAASLHPSLARKESHRSTRSQRRSLSIRRISAISYRGRNDFSDEDKPAETIPRNIEAVYEIEPFEFQMQRNLCGCTNPKTRVDVIGITNSLHDRQRFVDRRIALHPHKQEVEVAYSPLVIHCYLTQQHPEGEHPNLVRLHGYFVQQGTMHVLTEYYPLGSLMMVLDFDVTVQSNGRRKGLPFFRNENGLRRAVRQLCSALAYLHEQGVAHLDLALENIFADSQGNLHLGDFAHAVFIGKINQRCMAAPAPNRRAYAAPDLYSGREVDLIKADSWSLGIILFMLLTSRRQWTKPRHEIRTIDYCKCSV
ncbi:hypothetical protein Poli38472_008001 [Pythium oligandrum]|uniref:non-specific serine/threonine protein kinase n=1 Tax=Pythium oligandrum TaxID=41045 RepID=A0A8K1CLP5_PYTOL|nr:hypothetical protein Poli38472_008001 [Pythium oligandrum]|eukprot:TMW65359.1 hypothetical protein Poli38472_008001 [Pythium oligandrum]